MPDVELNFERSEYDDRIARTRAAMEKDGIDLLFAADPSNMSWLTGYDGWSFYVYQCVLLARRRRAGLVRPRHGRQRRQAHRLHGP